MQIKVIEVYFKEPKMVPAPDGRFITSDPYGNVEAGIAVQIDDELVHYRSSLRNHHLCLMPYEQVMTQLRHRIMQEIEKRLFNDFNVRD